MFKKSIFIIALIFTDFVMIHAQVPQLINYQAFLTDAAGNPINGNRTIQFKIYHQASGGTEIWSETQSITVTDGLFCVLLGSNTPILYPVFDGSDKYLSLKIGTDAEMTPRKRLVSVGYAFRANEASAINGANNIFPSSGSVGIGTTSPGSPLEVVNGMMISGNGSEGGQLTFLDGDRQGGWEIDNFGESGDEEFRIFRDRGYNDTFGLVINTSGDIGIGGELQANGTIHSQSGGFKFPDGTVQTTAAIGGGTADNLGNHTATQNIKLNGHWLSGDGNDEGIYVNGDGNIGIGTSTPTAKLDIVGGDVKINSLTIGRGSANIYSNSALGYNSLFSNTTGPENTAVGMEALYTNDIGGYNTALGSRTLYSNKGSQNTATGSRALHSNTTGDFNTATGSFALHYNSTGGFNTAIGNAALYSNTEGEHNTATGYRALYSNTTGWWNIAIGHQSLYSNTVGDVNTAIGPDALYNNTNGYGNIACGNDALKNNTTENFNTAIGDRAGIMPSDRGSFLGASATPNADGYSNVTGLGYEARPTASNQVRIGNSSVTSIGGQVSWTAFSDGRYKLAVTENVTGLDFIMKLRPVTYQLDINRLAADLKEGQLSDEKENMTMESSAIGLKARHEKSQIVYSGFVGQEVEQAAKEIGYDFSGVDAPKNENDFYGLRYAEFVVPLVKAVQEQQKMIEHLKNEVAALKKKLGE